MPELNTARLVGRISDRVIASLNLDLCCDTPIFLGETNIAHMKSRHPDDYAKYGDHIDEILTAPDFVGINPNDGSLEYVKEFFVDHEFVKVAVRVSCAGTFFVRSLYILNSSRVRNFIKKGTLVPLDKVP